MKVCRATICHLLFFVLVARTSCRPSTCMLVVSHLYYQPSYVSVWRPETNGTTHHPEPSLNLLPGRELDHNLIAKDCCKAIFGQNFIRFDLHVEKAEEVCQSHGQLCIGKTVAKPSVPIPLSLGATYFIPRHIRAPLPKETRYWSRPLESSPVQRSGTNSSTLGPQTLGLLCTE